MYIIAFDSYVEFSSKERTREKTIIPEGIYYAIQDNKNIEKLTIKQ